MAKIWAKSLNFDREISLSEHTSNLITQIRHLKESGLYKNIPEEWWKTLFYAAILHDIGKIDANFQINSLKNIDYPIKNNNFCSLPHSMLSLFFCKFKHVNISDNAEISELFLKTLRTAIVFHHWRQSLMDFSPEIYKKKAAEILNYRLEYEKILHQIKQNLSKTVKEFNELNLERVIDLNTNLISYAQQNGLDDESANLIIPYGLGYLYKRIAADLIDSYDDLPLRIFVLGNLMRVDHFASYLESIGDNALKIEAGGFLDRNGWHKAVTCKFGHDNYWQKDLVNSPAFKANKNCVFVAPTGVGKTEFACLWSAGNKTVYILPMKVMANSLHRRLCDFVGDNNVSLLHSDTAIILAEESKEDEDNTVNEAYLKNAVELTRQLTTPYIVCTADQLAPAVLGYPGYEKIFAVFMGSTIVIDEIQAYDPKAAAIMTYMALQTMRIGGKVLLMTATIPNFILNELRERQTTYKIAIEEYLDHNQELAKSCRHAINVRVYEENLLYEIVNQAKKGFKVLVAANTVEKAQKLYQEIEKKIIEDKNNIQILLIHSRFTFNDRRQKELLITQEIMPNIAERNKAGAIVVTTQVLEASVDADADYIYTELAPADSLVQRMGRGYRRYSRTNGVHVSTKESNVTIFLDSETLGSGIGTVYDLMLSLLTLICLYKLAYTKDDKEKFIEKFLNEVEEVFFNDPALNKLIKQNNQKKSVEIPVAYFINRYNIKEVFLLNETTKMLWVKAVYSCLEHLSCQDTNTAEAKKIIKSAKKYIKSFTDTIDALEHGFCAASKAEAQKLFREINDVNIIPLARKEEFKNELIKMNQIDYINLRELLNDFVVPIPNTKIKNKNEICQEPIVWAVREVGESFTNEEKRKLERYFQGIVFVNLKYTKKYGIEYD